MLSSNCFRRTLRCDLTFLLVQKLLLLVIVWERISFLAKVSPFGVSLARIMDESPSAFCYAMEILRLQFEKLHLKLSNLKCGKWLAEEEDDMYVCGKYN